MNVTRRTLSTESTTAATEAATNKTAETTRTKSYSVAGVKQALNEMKNIDPKQVVTDFKTQANNHATAVANSEVVKTIVTPDKWFARPDFVLTWGLLGLYWASVAFDFSPFRVIQELKYDFLMSSFIKKRIAENKAYSQPYGGNLSSEEDEFFKKRAQELEALRAASTTV
jgi:hypothetical protein